MERGDGMEVCGERMRSGRGVNGKFCISLRKAVICPMHTQTHGPVKACDACPVQGWAISPPGKAQHWDQRVRQLLLPGRMLEGWPGEA